jgi:hypothetical protein
MKNVSTPTWKNRLRHSAHQAADSLVDILAEIIDGFQQGGPAAGRGSHGARRRSPPVPTTPPDDLARARAERVLRDNGFRRAE